VVTWHDLPAKHEVKDIALYAEDISFSVREYVSAQTLSADNYIVLVDCSDTSITITLPAASSHKNRVYTLKKIDSSANKVTIDANSTETIDGEETIELKTQYTYVTIVSDGTEWFIIGGEYVKMEDTLGDVLGEQEKVNTNLEVLIEELKKTRGKLDRLAGAMYSEFKGEIED